jgi:HD superfamily phosphohydrolase
MVFPEARTSRFIHSLGVMNLASRFLISSLENADTESLNHFFGQLKGISPFNAYWPDAADLLKKTGFMSPFGALRLTFHQSGLEFDKEEARKQVALLEAGLRLAALFHDLGHLPFSHDFEYALDGYIKQSKADNPSLIGILRNEIAPHESIGQRLANFAFKALIDEVEGGRSPAIGYAFTLARDILKSNLRYEFMANPQSGIIEWLHSLIAGEVDADRADYLLRDGRALGLEFASYDLDRLISNLVLIFEENTGFSSAVDEHGLMALESYFVARSRSHEALVRHPKVAQIESALRYASIAALSSDAGKSFISVLSEIADQEDTINASRARDLLKKFARFTDAWWIQVLQQFRDVGTHSELLRACLDLVLDRERSLESVWKGRCDLGVDNINLLNKELDLLFSTSATQAEISDRFDDLLRKNILVVTHKFTPYARQQWKGGDDDSNSLATGRGGTGKDALDSVVRIRTKKERQLVSLSKVSPLVRSLQLAWSEDPHLHAFTLKGSGITPKDIFEMLVGEWKGSAELAPAV